MSVIHISLYRLQKVTALFKAAANRYDYDRLMVLDEYVVDAVAMATKDTSIPADVVAQHVQDILKTYKQLTDQGNNHLTKYQ